jgi:hypothetical protein
MGFTRQFWKKYFINTIQYVAIISSAPELSTGTKRAG